VRKKRGLMKEVNVGHGEKMLIPFSANWRSIVKDPSQWWRHIDGMVKVKNMNGKSKDDGW
jgi:hypothetical protein